MEVDNGLTDSQKHKNLCWLRKLIDEIEEYEPGVSRSTDELIQELVEFFYEIRHVFPNFNNIENPTNSPEVNENKSIAEEMANLLETDAPWEDEDTICVFKRFLGAVETLVQGTCDFDDMEVDGLLANLTIPEYIK